MPTTYITEIGARIRALVSEGLVPEGDSDALFAVYAVLVLAKGEAVTAADVHNAWAAWMSQIDPDHEAIRPFEVLPADMRDEDMPYVRALRSVARELAPSP